jgi:tripartite-type tricarboxylate transporter receptor subunit TctC
MLRRSTILVRAIGLNRLRSYAKANPGKVNMASSGTGSAPHVAGELFKMMAGVNMVHVPYRGLAPALTDLIGGQVQVLFDTIPTSLEHIRAGKLRPIGVTTTARSAVLPDVPAIGEFVGGYEASSYYGIGAPKGTSSDIIGRLNVEINAGLADAKIKSRLVDAGSVPLSMAPSEFGKLLIEETEKWGKVVRFAGIKPE